MRRTSPFITICCALIASTAVADSQAPHRLVWKRVPGTEACIDEVALAAAVEARLGRTVFTSAGNSAIEITAEVRRVGPGWRVAIAVSAADGTRLGERELEEAAADCRALDEALVLVLALIIDPDAAMRPPPPVPPTVQPPAPPPPRPPSPRPPVPVPAAEEPWRFAGSAAVIGAGGLLPGVAVGVDARASIDPPAVPQLALRGNLWLEDEQRDDAQGARFRLLTGGLVTCPTVWRLELCGGVVVGRLAAEGFGFDRVQQTAAFVAYLTVEPQLQVPLRAWLALTVAVGTWIPLVRPRFFFDQNGQAVEVHQPSVAAAVGHVGLTLRF